MHSHSCVGCYRSFELAGLEVAEYCTPRFVGGTGLVYNAAIVV